VPKQRLFSRVSQLSCEWLIAEAARPVACGLDRPVTSSSSCISRQLSCCSGMWLSWSEWLWRGAEAEAAAAVSAALPPLPQPVVPLPPPLDLSGVAEPAALHRSAAGRL
jgi:hypothetical protein